MRVYLSGLLAVIFGATLSACTASNEAAHHDHADEDSHHHDSAEAISHDKYGHMSAIYICGNDELQTSHTDAETTIAYKGDKFGVTRHVSVVDGAFGGESFKGEFKGDAYVFNGKGYDATLMINDEVISCEKISCIPLGGPH